MRIYLINIVSMIYALVGLSMISRTSQRRSEYYSEKWPEIDDNSVLGIEIVTIYH